jgi:hypothetical protein
MSRQRVPGTQPKAKKARKMHDEERDTTHPEMITEFLVAALMALGTPANVPTIWKNTREEVFYYNSLLPWRRSPVWLLIRVVLHLTICRSENASQRHGGLYKQSMVFLMADILSRYHEHRIQNDMAFVMSAKIHR